jgi:hypothetical protein
MPRYSDARRGLAWIHVFRTDDERASCGVAHDTGASGTFEKGYERLRVRSLENAAHAPRGQRWVEYLYLHPVPGVETARHFRHRFVVEDQ